jgi:hypothetical protein
MEDKVASEKIIIVLDVALRSPSARWWATHNSTLSFWDEVKLVIQHCFVPPSQVTYLNQEKEANIQTSTLVAYDGFCNPQEHVVHCIQVCEFVQLPPEFWVHKFIHSLGNAPTTWYIHEEAQQ